MRPSFRKGNRVLLRLIISESLDRKEVKPCLGCAGITAIMLVIMAAAMRAITVCTTAAITDSRDKTGQGRVLSPLPTALFREGKENSSLSITDSTTKNK